MKILLVGDVFFLTADGQTGLMKIIVAFSQFREKHLIKKVNDFLVFVLSDLRVNLK